MNALAFAVIAQEAPDAVQGRVTSAAIQLASLGAPVGPVLAGVLIGGFGAVDAIGIYGCAMLALAVLASASRRRLSHDPPALLRATEPVGDRGRSPSGERRG